MLTFQAGRIVWILISASAFCVYRYHMSCSPWKTSLYTYENTRMKEKNNILVFYDKTFDFEAPLKCLGHPQVFPDNTLRTVAVVDKLWPMDQMQP